MALKPADRYATPLDLAADIEHWLADEPVSAYREPWTKRLARWRRQHNTLVTSALAVLVVGLVALSVSTVLIGDALQKEQSARKDRALAQIKNLLEVAPQAVPTVLKELEVNRATVLPHVRELHATEKDRGRKMRLALALLPVEADQLRDDVADWLLTVKDPAEAIVVRDELTPHAAALPKAIHDRVLAEVLAAHDGQRFNLFFPMVAGAKDQYLAGFTRELGKQAEPAPVAKEVFKKEGAIAGDDPKIKTTDGRTLPAKMYQVELKEGIAYKIGMTSKEVDSFVVVQDSAGEELGFDDDSGGGLNSLLEFTPPKTESYKVYACALENKDAKSTGAFVLTITEAASAEPKENLASRRANAAIALLRTGDADKVWPLLKHTPDPSVRSYLVHRLGPMGVPWDVIVKRFDEEKDVSIRRALLLAPGASSEPRTSVNGGRASQGAPPEPLTSVRGSLVPKLLDIYKTDPDAGLHAAAAWLLTHWGEKDKLLAIDRELATAEIPKSVAAFARTRGKSGETPSRILANAATATMWWVNSQGQTMVAIPGPVEFKMGSPPTEVDRVAVNEPLHKRRIERTFALAAKPVTVEQYLRFQKSYAYIRKYAPEPDCPIVSTSWHQAAAYCNWLSKEERIAPDQWCYELNPQGQVTKMKENYLSLTGYRLPTEAEWEYACRAGAVTSGSYGDTANLLGHYGWYLKNSDDRSWPVGGKQPNDFGFFDMHGNVWNWCQDRALVYPQDLTGKGIEDKEDVLTINNQTSRVLRGGSFNNQASYLRCANRNYNVPTQRINNNGFRVARTLLP